VIFVANHVSQFDPLVLAHFIYDAGRWPRFLAKSGLFANPVLGHFFRQVHQIPVYRGTADAARALDHAVAAINAGHNVIIYPEGTTTREPNLWPMRGKTGAARLAVTTGAPVIPVTTWGAHRLFDPRTRRLRLRPLIPVTVVAGPRSISRRGSARSPRARIRRSRYSRR
jgi:1-acyl-sn-glycerol-3-phosphate acyltransferase